MVVIAHRLSTVQDADIIYVLEQGRVAEQVRSSTFFVVMGYFIPPLIQHSNRQGTHDELILLNGRYAELVTKSNLP